MRRRKESKGVEQLKKGLVWSGICIALLALGTVVGVALSVSPNQVAAFTEDINATMAAESDAAIEKALAAKEASGVNVPLASLLPETPEDAKSRKALLDWANHSEFMKESMTARGQHLEAAVADSLNTAFVGGGAE